ncbi:methionyl-tRNA formyltransferase [Dictyobacter arantiisoli]|uniref:methionyl-tRNA formyltransferase n=1 Tax=Dictyobacter arantiisoli TaxID=2014874 RepID=A0A5A5TJG1_9CHLR|nr:methionyl-tRNA formyltransferase [Dictyobacter arantiisoli]GCF11482.1 formyl transferase [Dictyobacter arantiisoli]
MDSTLSSLQRRPRVLFFGIECDFSLIALQSLLEQAIDVLAVVVSQAGTMLPGIHIPSAIVSITPPRQAGRILPMKKMAPTSIVQLAWEQRIPVWQVNKPGDAETLSILSAYQADLICVACFATFIPPSLLALPRLGCINLHPSLLPANRGPLPLFWTFQRGDQLTGASIHMMTAKLDSGPILTQEAFPIPHGIRYAVLERQCAQLGARLLVQAVFDLYHGRADPQAQDELLSSYYPYPTDDDYVVNARKWTAHRLYNFIRGVASRERPIEVLTAQGYILATDATAYSHKGVQVKADDAKEDSDKAECVRCQDGEVHVLL